MSESTILLDISADRVATLTIDRPDKANAMNEVMIADFHRLLGIIEDTKDLRALVLRASGKHFCAGADLEWMRSSKDLGYGENVADAACLYDVFMRLKDLTVPTVALVQGSAYGGALGLVAACDISLSVDTAIFSLREVRLGLLPAVVLPFLRTKVKPSLLHYWAMTAVDVDAKEAVDAGLLTHAVPESQFEKEYERTLEMILKAGPQALHRYKYLVHRLEEGGGAKMVRSLCTQTIAETRISPEAQIRLTKFLS